MRQLMGQYGREERDRSRHGNGPNRHKRPIGVPVGERPHTEGRRDQAKDHDQTQIEIDVDAKQSPEAKTRGERNARPLASLPCAALTGLRQLAS